METNSLPLDTKPRRHRPYSPEQITEYLEAQARSGLSIARFCQPHGLSPSVFYAWKRRRRQTATSPLAFREVSVSPFLSASWSAEVLLPSGVLLRVSPQADPRWIGQLLDQMSRS